MKLNLKKVAVAAAAAVAAGSSFAADATTVGGLATGISFADVALAVLAVAGTLIALHVTIKGAKQVMHFIGK